MKLLLTNARIIDPYHDRDEPGEVAIDGNAIVDRHALAAGVETVDLGGRVVCPGLIDLHVHFREPGFAYKEDIATGSAAAAAGGFTTVVVMPNTNPALDCVTAVQDQVARIRAKARVNVLIAACLTIGRRGESLTDIEALAGLPAVVALSDDGDCVQNLALMQQAARLAKAAGLPITDHCEDRCVMAGGVMRDGELAKVLQLPGMPGETESNIVARNIALARETGVHFHLQHVSYVTSVAHLRKAQAAGVTVTAEATPHHLCLTSEILPIMGSNAKMNPPLGTEADRQSLIAAVVDGTISCIATDHAPHAAHEKLRGFVEAPFGIIGLETAVPLCLTQLYHTGLMSLSDLLARFTAGPAAVLGLPATGLTPGSVADLTILAPDEAHVIDVHASQSRSRNSPFHGRPVVGRVAGTICGGNWAWRQGV